MEPLTALTIALSTAGGAIASILGGFDHILQGLLVVMGCDIVSGILVSVYYKRSPKTKSGRFNSKVFRKGLTQKGLCLLVIVVAHILDVVSGLNMIRDSTILFYILEESMSVLENAVLMGVPIPKQIRDILDILQDQDEDVLDDMEFPVKHKRKSRADRRLDKVRRKKRD